ncbi:hypothetical protein Q5P01_009034 [Channa striata]|uniref:Ig-like domain-containing protein n=1 Tax=Channa striata TaxID=64152 RepID=A0AA88SZY7_CHASR|nr:hypothetical protein Q5P01_009034 [Channa striata]
MEAVVGLLVMLLGVSSGVETNCDGRQNGTQCYGALGGTVVLQLIKPSEISRFQWTKNNTVIIRWRHNSFIENKIQDRSLFTLSNGTFRINNLNRNDGGEYKLEIHDSNGKTLSSRYLQFSFQAPVSSVLLVSECLSQGEMRVSCSSEGGDSPQYSWTLDGHTLTDAELLSGNKETNNITLKQHVSGNLVCSVRNHVSHVSKEETISDCGFIFINCMSSNGTHISQWVFAANNTLCVEPTTTTVPTVVIGLAVICTQTRKKNIKPKKEDNEEELTYADVRVTQRQERQLQQTAEVEVEYGQVRFSGRPRQTVRPSGDDCVYAKVCRDR